MHLSITELLVAAAVGGAIVCGSAPAEQQAAVCAAAPAASAPETAPARCHRGLESPTFDDLVHRLPDTRPQPEAVWL